MPKQPKRVTVKCSKCGIRGKVQVQGSGHIKMLGQAHREVQHNQRSQGFLRRRPR